MIYVDIKKSFGTFNLDLKVQGDNKIIGLLGASGSGKSLSLKCIAGIERPDSGKIILNDRVLFDSEKNINLRVQDRKIGYLFQDYALFPNMTVIENIHSGLRDKNPQALEFLERVIEDLDLTSLRDLPVDKLSGGEKQRVALARILVNQPDILFLDEPFSALDDYLKWKVEASLKEIIEKYKLPTIFVSHSRDEVYRMCDQIIVMDQGKSQKQEKTQDLFENPKTFSKALISGCKNFSKIEKISDQEVFALDWNIKLKVENYQGQDMLGIRAHRIRISNREEENSFRLENYKLVDDLFQKLIIINFNDGPYSSLRISIDKKVWKDLENEKNLYVVLDKEELILLNLKE